MTDIGQINFDASASLRSHLHPVGLNQFDSFESAAEAGCEMVLIAAGDELGLASVVLGEKAALEINFVGGSLGHRFQFGGGRNQDICRAVGLNRTSDLSIADATAGLGRDAFVLASNGAEVLGFEKNPVLGRMLDWSLQRAKMLADQTSSEQNLAFQSKGFELSSTLSRLSFQFADSVSSLQARSFDVVYLDPMFPERDKSAKVKKEMQILHQLLAGKSEGDHALFDSCWSATLIRLVIKRPVKAPFFADRKPHHQVVGKTIRYDVYVKKALV